MRGSKAPDPFLDGFAIPSGHARMNQSEQSPRLRLSARDFFQRFPDRLLFGGDRASEGIDGHGSAQHTPLVLGPAGRLTALVLPDEDQRRKDQASPEPQLPVAGDPHRE